MSHSLSSLLSLIQTHLPKTLRTLSITEKWRLLQPHLYSAENGLFSRERLLHGRLYPTVLEKQRLCEALHAKNLQEVQQFLERLNNADHEFLRRNSGEGMQQAKHARAWGISTHDKATVRKWFQEYYSVDASCGEKEEASPSKMPPLSEIIQLQEETNLSRDQIKRLIRTMMTGSGVRITPEIRKFVKGYLGHTPTLDSAALDEICSHTGMSRRQLHNLLPELVPRGEITVDKRQVIDQWLGVHAYRAPRMPELRLLASRTSLSVAQVKFLARSLREKHFSIYTSPEAIEQLENWIQVHKRFPDTTERGTLCEELGMTRRQITAAVRRLKNRTQSRPSKEAKDFLLTWLRENKFESPTEEQRDHLQAQTKLTRDQLKLQLYHLIHRHRRLINNVHVVELVDQWLDAHANRMPSQSQMHELVEKIRRLESNVIQTQVLHLVRQRRKMRVTAGPEDRVQHNESSS